MENIRQTREVCDRFGIPLFIDACRFAENAWFIKQREPEMASATAGQIARLVFKLADGVMISGCAEGDCYYRLGN